MEEEHPVVAANSANVANTERNLFNAFIRAFLSSSHTTERYSTWLLAGTAATAALFVTSMGSIIPILSVHGFKVCGATLTISGLFGLISKLKAGAVESYLNRQEVMESLINKAFDEHDESEDKIIEAARINKIEVETAVDMKRVAEQVLELLPPWVRYLEKRSMAKMNKTNRSSERAVLRAFLMQGYASALQTILFVSFIVVALAYAAAT